jgi:GNAT superfamily N-acetyltransferase
MTALTAAPTTSTERARCVATLLAAFAADPVIRWTFPRPDRYLDHFPRLVDLMGGRAFDRGTVDHVADSAGVTLWLAPGETSDDDGLAELLEATIDPDRKPTAYAFLEQLHAHHPTAAHWYLPFMGVDPRCQGQGLGSALLDQGLARCDRDGLPAYLEATSSRNRALYERHGFEVAGEIQAGDSPPLWPMLRQAR